ncbi:16946_t:CDS:1, partial [Cetraspora pellucida]
IKESDIDEIGLQVKTLKELAHILRQRIESYNSNESYFDAKISAN